MSQELDLQTITITPAAVQAVQNVFEERGLAGYALRVYVAGSTCCGINFGLALDNNHQDSDTTIETDGIKVIVDGAALEYLQGATIDFINDPLKGQGFAIHGPNVAKHRQDEDNGDCAGCSCGN